MKTHFKRASRGFSLTEMLVVIAIIAILAALTISGMNYVEAKKARDAARVQIGLLSTALQEYFADYGTYPGSDPAETQDSSVVFAALYPETDASGATLDGRRIYLPELDPDNDRQGWLDGREWGSASGVSLSINGTVTSARGFPIIDPWGNPYQYRRPGKRNPEEFDIFSMGKDGQEGTEDDIGNW